MDGVHILLVMRETEARHALMRAVQRAGHRCTAVDLGARAVALLRHFAMDVVVVDALLADITGPRLCCQLRRGTTTAETTTLLISSTVHPAARSTECRLCGASEHVAPAALLQAIEHHAQRDTTTP
jgi:DNA-binding response OmpR family regulator